MKNTRENDKKRIEALQERNRVLEEVLSLTQLENKELTEQLRIADVVSSAATKTADDDEGWIYCPNCGRIKADN